MKKVQSSEAKTHLPQLLDEVARGETIVITRHGRAIARLVPEVDGRREDIRNAIQDMKVLRASLPKTGLTVEEILRLRHEGHKH